MATLAAPWATLSRKVTQADGTQGERSLQMAEKGEAHPWDRGPRRPVGARRAADTAAPLLSRMCSSPGGRGDPCAILAADTCFLPLLSLRTSTLTGAVRPGRNC